MPSSIRNLLTLRFSLRAMLVVILVMSIPLAVLSDQKRRQLRVIRSLKQYEGGVWNVDFEQSGMIIPTRSRWLPSFAYVLLPESRNYIYLCGDRIGDEQVRIASTLPNLQGMNISGSKLSDRGLSELSRCTDLKELQLYKVTTLTHEAIAAFRRAHPKCDVHTDGRR